MSVIFTFSKANYLDAGEVSLIRLCCRYPMVETKIQEEIIQNLFEAYYYCVRPRLDNIRQGLISFTSRFQKWIFALSKPIPTTTLPPHETSNRHSYEIASKRLLRHCTAPGTPFFDPRFATNTFKRNFTFTRSFSTVRLKIMIDFNERSIGNPRKHARSFSYERIKMENCRRRS
jgi:hypothetical protein